MCYPGRLAYVGMTLHYVITGRIAPIRGRRAQDVYITFYDAIVVCRKPWSGELLLFEFL